MEAEKMLMLVTIVATIIQIAKEIPHIVKFKAWFPYVSVILGIVLALIWSVPEPVIASIMIGLTASGSYDFLKPKKAA